MGRRPAEKSSEQTTEKRAGPGNPGIWSGERRDFLMGFVGAYGENGRGVAAKGYVPTVVDKYLGRWPYHFHDGPRNIPANATPEERAQLEAQQQAEAREQATPQIRSFLKNNSAKLNAIKKSPYRDFFRTILKQLSATRARREAEYKIWMRQPEYRDEYLEEFERRWATADKPSTQELAFRVQIAQEVYERQDEEVKKHVKQLVQEDYDRQVACNAAVESGEVTPESAQLCRDNLSALAEPLIKELLRLCDLTVGTLLLARPPTVEGEKISVMLVNVGETVASEGGVKLPDFESEAYANFFLRHFMRFVVYTNEKSIALHLAEEQRQKIAAQKARGKDVDDAVEGAANDLDAAQGATGVVDGRRDPNAAPHHEFVPKSRKHSRKRARRPRRRAHASIDAEELTDKETSESSPSASSSDGSESDDDDEDAHARPARAIKEAQQRQVRERRDAAEIPVDEYGVPLRNVRGRVFSSFLRERLSRMSDAKRTALLLDIDTMSDYEFNRQETISKNECELRAVLLRDGILQRTDPLYGDITPKRVDAAPSTPASEREPSPSPDADPHTQPAAGADINMQEQRVRRGEREREGHMRDEDIDESDAARAEGVAGNAKSGVSSEQAGVERGRNGDSERDVEPERNDDPERNDEPERNDDLERNDNPERDAERGGARGGRSGARAPKSKRGLALEGGNCEEAPAPSVQHSRGVRHSDARERGQTTARAKHGEAQQDVAAPETRPTTGQKRGRKGDKARGSHNEGVADIFSASREGWEDWFALGIDNLVLDAAAPESEADTSWRRLVATYAELEKRENYKKDKRAPPNGHRPEEIGEWIKRARSTTYMPKPRRDQPPADFIDDWRTSMWLWWSSLNPPWRERIASGFVRKTAESGDWSGLYYAGPNGLLSVLKGAKWWFDLEEKPEGTLSWLEFIHDVQWALDGLLSQLGIPAKDEQRPAKRRKAQ